MSVKLLIDKTRNKVVFAESDSDFIDILFSFLTLPLGAVARLVHPHSTEIGSIDRIYGSVEAMEPHLFRTELCKEMLLNPRNASETQCKELKINVNPHEQPVKFYCCDFEGCNKSTDLSTFKGAKCGNGHPSNVHARIHGNNRQERVVGNVGVFLKGGTTTRFIVTDDLRVMYGSTASYIVLLSELGINDLKNIEERTVNFKDEEVLRLLKVSLVSKSPLTQAFLSNQASVVKDPVECEHNKPAALRKKDAATESNSISMKLVVSRSKREVLFAETGIDLVDFLLSFLTIPLGSLVKLLCGNSRLWCIDNLYKSAEVWSSANYFKSDESEKMIISPKIAPFFSYEHQFYQIEEASYPHFSYNNHCPYWTFRSATEKENEYSAILVDPKSPNGETQKGKGFMKRGALYMITDDLTIALQSPVSSIAILKRLNVNVNDVEERTVTMGKDEALMMLKASLYSKTVLTDVFY